MEANEERLKLEREKDLHEMQFAKEHQAAQMESERNTLRAEWTEEKEVFQYQQFLLQKQMEELACARRSFSELRDTLGADLNHCSNCQSNLAEVCVLRKTLERLDEAVSRWLPLQEWDDLAYMSGGSLERRIGELVSRATNAVEESRCLSEEITQYTMRHEDDLAKLEIAVRRYDQARCEIQKLKDELRTKDKGLQDARLQIRALEGKLKYSPQQAIGF